MVNLQNSKIIMDSVSIPVKKSGVSQSTVSGPATSISYINDIMDDI